MAAATSDTTTALTALPSTISLIGGHASKPWADTPYPLIDTIPSTSDIPPKHSCREMAYTMTQIHNAILRGINAIYNQALSVKAGSPDTADFLFYNRCVYDFLHHHHVNEEKTFFPLLQKLTRDPTFCDTGRKEHDVFDVGAGKWREYIDNVKLEEYDGQKLKGLIEAFGPSLHQHLTNEIAWLLTLSKYDSNACKKAMLETGKKAEAEVTLSKDLPLILGCQDASFTIDGRKGIFPSIPTPLLYLVKYTFAKKYASAWRFAPSDVLGKKKDLVF